MMSKLIAAGFHLAIQLVGGAFLYTRPSRLAQCNIFHIVIRRQSSTP